MPVTVHLSRRLHEILGDDAAEDLVTWIQQVDAQNELHFARFDARLAEMRADCAELRQEMQVGFARLETKIEQRSADLIKWSFVFWVGAVGAIALLAGVLR